MPVQIQLPGGLVRDGDRHRRVQLRPLTGRLELTMAESREASESRVAQTNAVLGAIVERVGEHAGSPGLVEQLCVADRQVLMFRLAQLLRGGSAWIARPCSACGEGFDVEVDLAQLPVVEAGAGYPAAEVELRGQRVRVRVPTGRDQAVIASMELLDEERAIRELALRCLDEDSERELEDEELAIVDEVLDRISPAVATTLSVVCPICESPELVELDPHALVVGGGGLGEIGILEEIHALACHYHWSEAEILDLPRARRRRYLALIDRERGIEGDG